MNNKILLIGGGIAAALLLANKTWAQKESLKYFQYSLSGVRFNLKNLISPEIIFSIRVFNPNSMTIPVNDVFGNIKHEGSNLASFRNTEEITLPGRTEKVINISSRINALSILTKIITKTKVGSVEVDGVINTPMFSMPINKLVTLSSLAGTDDDGKTWQATTLPNPGILMPYKKNRKRSNRLFQHKPGCVCPGTAS